MMFNGQVNRVHGGSPADAGRPRRLRAKPLAGGFCVVLVMTLVLSWSTAAFAVKPPPKRARPMPKESVRAKRREPPKSVTRVARDPATATPKTTKEEPVKIPGPGEPRPVIQCKDPVKDFGTIWVGPVLEHSFTIENTGEAPLRITKVRPSCGCTIAGPYPKAFEA